MKRILLYTLIAFLFIQCGSTSSLNQVKRLVNKSTNLKFLNPTEFEASRKFMLEKLGDEIVSSDTIIILEEFPDGVGDYNTSIYESNNKTVRSYYAARNPTNLTVIDSLVCWPFRSNILAMVVRGEIEEVKYKGDNSTLTPTAHMIINIITKNKKGKFVTKTILTYDFAP